MKRIISDLFKFAIRSFNKKKDPIKAENLDKKNDPTAFEIKQGKDGQKTILTSSQAGEVLIAKQLEEKLREEIALGNQPVMGSYEQGDLSGEHHVTRRDESIILGDAADSQSTGFISIEDVLNDLEKSLIEEDNSFLKGVRGDSHIELQKLDKKTTLDQKRQIITNNIFALFNKNLMRDPENYGQQIKMIEDNDESKESYKKFQQLIQRELEEIPGFKDRITAFMKAASQEQKEQLAIFYHLKQAKVPQGFHNIDGKLSKEQLKNMISNHVGFTLRLLKVFDPNNSQGGVIKANIDKDKEIALKEILLNYKAQGKTQLPQKPQQAIEDTLEDVSQPGPKKFAPPEQKKPKAITIYSQKEVIESLVRYASSIDNLIKKLDEDSDPESSINKYSKFNQVLNHAIGTNLGIERSSRNSSNSLTRMFASLKDKLNSSKDEKDWQLLEKSVKQALANMFLPQESEVKAPPAAPAQGRANLKQKIVFLDHIQEFDPEISHRLSFRHFLNTQGIIKADDYHNQTSYEDKKSHIIKYADYLKKELKAIYQALESWKPGEAELGQN